LPEDAWQKARTRDLIRRTRRERRAAERRQHEKVVRKQVENAKAHPSNWHPQCKLWFGKHHDQPIDTIPSDYLAWLVSSHTPGKFWRMDRLVDFLRRYLEERRVAESYSP